MGTFIIRMNMIASWVGGWIVVGLPDVGAGMGPSAFGFLMICTAIGSTVNVVWPPLARMIKHRNYLGPNDYVSDRFNSVRPRESCCCENSSAENAH